MWSIDDVAEYFGISRRWARKWIVYDGLIEYRLGRINRTKARVFITTEELVKLRDMKRPSASVPSVARDIFENERVTKGRAGKLGILARRAKKAEQDKTKTQSLESIPSS